MDNLPVVILSVSPPPDACQQMEQKAFVKQICLLLLDDVNCLEIPDWRSPKSTETKQKNPDKQPKVITKLDSLSRSS